MQLSFATFAAPALYTAGYQGRTPDALVRLMEKHAIAQLIDVREHPVSRRPGFGKATLAATLDAAGLSYVHLKEAGNPFRHSSAALEQYAENLDAHPEIVEAVAAAARDRTSMLLCFERDPLQCHRTPLGERVARQLAVPLVAV